MKLKEATKAGDCDLMAIGHYSNYGKQIKDYNIFRKERGI